MLGIVLANSFLMLFIFWELVGVSSYLLIGHWFERPSAADACKKAFLTNRLGDFAFLLGILMLWAMAGGLNFSLVEDQLKQNPALFGSMTTLVGLLVFCGAAGKSAQFPLHVWLPDAMEGPTSRPTRFSKRFSFSARARSSTRFITSRTSGEWARLATG